MRGGDADDGEASPGRPPTSRRGRKAQPVVVGADDATVLIRWAAGVDAPLGLARRARIVLACAAGASNQEVATQLGTSAHLVGRWRARFAGGGLAALVRQARPGAPVQMGRGLEPAGPDAAVDGIRISRSTAGRLARASALRPDAESGPIPRDAVLAGVHVFVGDQVFALVAPRGDESEPVAPTPPDDTPLAALDARVREHVAATLKRHSPLRMKRFLKHLESRAADAPIHLVLFGAPSGVVRRWLGRRPRFVVHGTGTRHAWWALLARWWSTAGDGSAEAITTFLAAPGYEVRAFDWLLRP